MEPATDSQRRSEELNWLKAIVLLYSEPDKSLAKIKRLYILISCGALSLLGFAIIGIYFGFLRHSDSFVMSLFAGAGCGIGFMYYSICRTVHYQVRYTALREELVQQRILELEGLDSKTTGDK